MNVHLKGAFLMGSEGLSKHMVDAGFGRIVSLSSSSALGNRGQANYAAVKAGLRVSPRPWPRSSAGSASRPTPWLRGSS